MIQILQKSSQKSDDILLWGLCHIHGKFIFIALMKSLNLICRRVSLFIITYVTSHLCVVACGLLACPAAVACAPLPLPLLYAFLATALPLTM